MIDLNLLRNEIEWVSKQLARRKFLIDIDYFRQQDKLIKNFRKKIAFLQAERKAQSKVIGIAKIQGKNIQNLCKEVDLLNQKLSSIKIENRILQNKILEYRLSLPNIPDDHIPNGYSDHNNVEIMRWGKIHHYNFKILDHVTLGKVISGIDLSSAVKITGTRFVILKGKIARLHRALAQFMVDLHTQNHGYEEYYLPYLVNTESLYGSGQLPKFDRDLFNIRPTSDKLITDSYSLIPTAEVPLINLMRGIVVEEKALPIKMVAHTPCFRSEAGTYGRRSSGLIRTHQFDKVELIQIVHPDQSEKALEEITKHAEKVLQLLELPYRKVLLCAGNISFSACKTYDLEVWLPTHNTYCEISSCSNTRDFQSRRIKACFRSKIHKKLRLLHILNASGVAVGRALVAILENYQLQNGRVAIPKVLSPYMNGITYIE